MAALKQLGLVLWKNLILRTREPLVFLFEIVWPILIFLVVVLVRMQIDPEDKTSCVYAPRANPSAGFEFLQDYACNIDNKCYADEQEASESRDLSGASSFLRALEPLYEESEKTMTFLNALPDTVQVLDSLSEALEDEDIQELLDPKNQPKLRDLFDDPDEIENYFVVEEILTAAQARDFLNASIKIAKIFELTLDIDLPSIVCNASLLESYFNFTEGVNVEEVATSLCAINDSLIADMTDFFVAHLSFTKILRLLRDFEYRLGQLDMAAIFDAFAEMLELDLQSLQLLDVAWLGPWAKDVLQFVRAFLQGGNWLENLGLFGPILEGLEPLFDDVPGDLSVIQVLKDLIGYYSVAQDILTGQLSGGFDLESLSLGSLLPNQTGLLNVLTSTYNISEDLAKQLLTLNFNPEKLTEYISQVTGGVDVSDALCTDPGLASIFAPDNRVTADQLQAIQEAICQGNGSVAAELTEALGLQPLMDKVNQMESSNSTDIDWTGLLEDSSQFILTLNTSLQSLDTMLDLFRSGFRLEDVYLSLASAAGSLQNLDANSSLLGLLPLTSQLGRLVSNQQFDLFGYIGYVMVDILDKMADKIPEAAYVLADLMSESADLRGVVEDVLTWQPDQAPVILARLFDPIRLQVLFESGQDVDLLLCDPDGLSEFLDLDPQLTNVTALSGILCGRDLDEVLLTLSDSFDMDEINEQFNTLLLVIQGKVTPNFTVDYIAMSEKIMTVQTKLSDQVIAMVFMDALGDVWVGHPVNEAASSEWVAFINQFSLQYALSIGGSLLENLGAQLEESDAWYILAPWLKTLDLAITTIEEIFRSISIVQDESSVTGSITRMAVLYLPELLYEVAETLNSSKGEQFLTELSTDPVALFCDYDKLESYLEPSDRLPLQQIVTALCTLDVEAFQAPFVDAYVELFYNIEMMTGYIGLTKSDVYDKSLDWAGLYQRSQTLTTKLTEFVTDESLWQLWSGFDYTRANKAVMLLLQGAMNVEVSQAASLVAQQEQALEGLLSSLGDTDMFTYYMVGVQWYLEVLNKYLLSGGDGLSLSELLGNSTWLEGRVSEALDVSPDVLESLSSAVLKPEQLMTLLLTTNLTGQELCRDLSLSQFLTLTDPTKVKDLESLLCGVEVDVLLQSLLASGMLADISEVTAFLQDYDPARLPANMSVSLSEVVTTVMETLTLLTTAMNTTESLQSLLFPELMDINVGGINTIGKSLIDSLMNLTLGDVAEWSSLTGQLLGSLNGQTSPELNFIFSYMEASIDMSLRSLVVLDPEQLSLMFPVLSEYLLVTNVLPEVMAAAALTATQTGTSPYASLIVSNPALLCNVTNLEDIIVLPPDSQINLTAFRTQLCTLNLTVVMSEANAMFEYIAGPLMIVLNTPPDMLPEVNITAVFIKQAMLQQHIDQLFSQSLEETLGAFITGMQWISGDLWDYQAALVVNNSVSQISANPGDYASAFGGLQELSAMLNLPEFNQQLNLVLVILQQMNEKLNMLQDNSSLADMFPSSPELAKLATMMEEFPYVFELLQSLTTGPTPEFNALLSNPNTTIVLFTICHPLTDIQTYFPEPPSWAGRGLSVEALRDRFCQVDFVALQEEINEEFDMVYFMPVNPNPVNWTTLYIHLDMAINNLARVLSSPPKEFTTDAWQNSSFWLSALLSGGQLMDQDPMSAETYQGIIELLYGVLGDDSDILTSLAGAVNEVTQSINQQILLLTKPDLSLFDVFSDSPELLALLNASLGSTDEALSSVLGVPFSNPMMLLQLQAMSSEELCNQSLSYYKQVFATSDDQVAANIRTFVCNLNSTVWQAIQAELAAKVGLAEILALAGFSNNTDAASAGINSTLAAQLNWAQLAQSLTDLGINVEDLMDGFNAAALIPEFSQAEVEELIEALYTNISVENIDTLLPALMAGLSPLYGTDTWDMLDDYVKAIDTIIQYLNDMLMMLSPNGEDGSVDLQTLFGGADQWNQVLQTAFSEVPDILPSLYGISVKVDKVPVLVMLDDASLGRLLCSEEMMRDYFIFPDSVNVTVIVKGVCGLNTTQLSQEFEQTFQFMGLIERITNPTLEDLNVTDMIMRYTQFIVDIAALTNITDWSFFEQTVGQFVNIDLTSLENTEDLLTSLSSMGVLDMDDVSTNFTSIMDITDFIYETLKASAAGLGSMYQDEGTNALLRLMNAIIMTMGDRLAMSMPGELTLGSLVGNIGDLELVLQDTFQLEPEVMAAILTSPIPTYAILELVIASNAGVLGSTYCHPNITSELPASINGTADDLLLQLCNLDYDALWEEIQDHINYEELATLFEEVVNPNTMAYSMFNWTEYAENFDSWKYIIDNLGYALTNPSEDLAGLFTPERLWAFAEAIMQTQASAAIEDIGFDFLSDLPPLSWIDMSALEIATEAVLEQLQMLRDSGVTFGELLTNTSALTQWYTRLSVFTSSLSSSLALQVEAELFFDTLPMDQTAFKSMVCNVNNLTIVLMTTAAEYSFSFKPYWDIQKISDILCTESRSEWWNALTDAGFGWNDIHSISYILQLHSGEIPNPEPKGWDQVVENLSELTQLLTDLDDLTQTLTNFTEADLMALLGALNAAQLESILPLTTENLRTLSLLRIGPPGLLPAMVYTMGYLNTRLETLLGNGSTIDLSELIPNEAEARMRLSTILSEASIDDLFQLSVNPMLLMQFDSAENWQMLVCNTTAFSQLIDMDDVSDPNRLQMELCDAALDGDDVMGVLLDLVEFNTYLMEVMEIAQREAMEDPFAAFQAQMGVLLSNIGRIQGLEDFEDMESWLGLLEGLAGTDLPLVEDQQYTDMCEAGVSVLTEYLGEGVTMSLSLNQEYMDLIIMLSETLPDLTNLTCDLPQMSLLELFGNASGLIDFSAQFSELLGRTFAYTPVGSRQFDCVSYMETVTRYIEIISRDYISLDSQLRVALGCLAGSANATIPSLQQVDWYMDILLQLQDVIKNAPELSGLMDILDTTLLEVILNQFVERDDVMLSLSHILREDVDTMEMFLNLTGLMQDELNDLLDASISGLTLMSLWDLSDEELEEFLCGDGKLGEVFQFPDELMTNISIISAKLCEANLTQILNVSRESLDIGAVLYHISNANTETLLNIDWLIELLGNLTQITESGVDLMNIMEIVGDINIDNLPDAIDLLFQFSEDDSAQVILDSLDSIIAILEGTFNTDDQLTNAFIQDLKTLVNALRALQIFPGLSVTVRDVLIDPKEVEYYMQTELGLPETVTTAILDGTLNNWILSMLPGMLDDVERYVCSEGLLGDVIEMKGNLTQVVSQLCTLSQPQLEGLIDKLTEHLSIGSFVMEVLAVSPGQIFANAGIDEEALMGVFEAILPLQQNLEDFAYNLNNMSTELFTLVQPLQGGQLGTFDSLSSILCGRPDAFNIEDEFQIGSSDEESDTSSRRRKKRQTEEEARWQDYERSRFETKFCKEEVYNELISSDRGRVIWSFLKPLMIGKILVYPSNIITEAIMRDAVSIFNLSDIVDFAKSFIVAADAIKDIAANQERLNNLQGNLQNPIVSVLVDMLVGVDSSTFADLLDYLGDIDPEQLDAMVEIASFLKNASECVSSTRLIRMNSEEELELQAKDLALKNELLAAVVFLDMDEKDYPKYNQNFNICQQAGNDMIPKHIQFKIRMDADDTPQTKAVRRAFWMPDADDSFAEDLRYFRGFIQMQDLMESAIVKLQTGCEGEMPMVESQQFPHPCHEDDIFQRFVGLYIFPILMVLSQLVVVGVSIRNVVYDKEHRLEETMKAMGLRPGVNWFGWFLNTYIMMLITDLIIVLFLHFGGLFRYSDFGLLFVYLALFSFSTLMLCYLVSVFFFRTTLAALVGLIVYLLSYVPYIVLANLVLYGMEFWQIFLACLSSTTAFSFGAQMLAQMELRSVGMQWSDISGTPVYNNFPFAWVFYMMLIDSAIYILLAWYLRNVLPGKYGVRQPVYFFLLPSYWGCNCGQTSSAYKPQHHGGQGGSGSVQGVYKRTGDQSSSAESLTPGESHMKNKLGNPMLPDEIQHREEEELARLPVGVSLHNLSKKFGSKKSVLNLNVNFHQEQITAFLGQNGAGKTTTVNLLTGIYEPSSGDAFVSSKSIRTQMGSIRTNLGVCPQHDVLFDYLTVREHLDFFASLKGSQSKKDRKNDIDRMIELTGLENHANVKVRELSGGQKRRVSVALAFIGGSKVIILDEPTSGIDPSARRNIWDLITQNRAGRTIILSTHHMDEADVLGDRVILLHKGCILTTGSPLFLKSQYGSGYNLTVSKDVAGNPPHVANARSGCDPSMITSFLSQYVPDAQLVEEVGTEMSFMLPTHQGQLARFPEMFAHFEKQKFDLGVSSYGVSDTTLEEVFLKLTMSADNHQSLEPDQLRQWHLNRDSMEKGALNGASSHSPVNGSEPEKREATSAPVTQQNPNACVQMMALFYKRFLHHARDMRNYLSQIILPVLFILLAMGMTIIVPSNNNEPSILLVPDLYEDTTSFYRLENNDLLFKDFEASMLEHPWLGTTCITDDEEYSSICHGNVEDWQTGTIPRDKRKQYEEPGECTCNDNRHNCPEGAGGLPSPHKILGSGLDMYNLTDNQFELQDYLLRTYTEFIEDRYGGFSFSTEEESARRVKVWYNNKGYHSLPAYQNAMANTLLRTRVADMMNGTATPQEYGISVYNHPLKLDKEKLGEMTLLQSVAQTGLALVVLCAFCFIPAGCSIFIVSERLSHERQLQMIYGVGTVMYWLVAIIWDMLTYLVSVALAVGIAKAFNIDIYTEKDNLGAFAVVLIMFGWACIPLVYLLSRMFKSVETAYIVIFLLNFLIGLVTVCCTFLLSLFTYVEEISEAYEILSHVFKIFPQFCFGDALVLLSRNQFITNIYEGFNIDKYKDPYSYDMIAWHLVAMAIQGAVFYILNLMMEIRCRRTSSIPPKDRVMEGLEHGGPKLHGNKSPFRLNHNNKGRNHKEDNDVSLERQRVTTGDARSDLLVLHDLKKMYRRGFKKVRAVNDLSLGIPRGECFGLLGVNGAGKTTTFNMITSEITPSRGVALLNGRVISEDVGNMMGQVGYCPQFDALDQFLTGKQLLYFYSLVKGIQDSRQTIDYLVKAVGLVTHQDRLIKTYSGGTKRKLSTAIALLGNPDLILMDEPTTGMDAGSRRMVWNSIQDAVSRGSSVVLTSHSMIECDALCTRMAVMVNGRFKCLGNSQHLKSKFGTGYTVVIRVSGVPPDIPKVTNFMLANFDGCFLKDFHLNQLEFEIPTSAVSLSQVFGRLETEKSMLHIQEYSVSQPTLEQVFIGFAKHQHDGEDDEVVETPNRAYDNLGYGTISSLGRGAEVRKSLKSIPGYDPGLVKPEDVTVDVNDRPSSSSASSSGPSSDRGSGSGFDGGRPTSSASDQPPPSSSASSTASPASTVAMRGPGEDEVGIVDPVSGETTGVMHQDGNTTVVEL